MNSLNLAKLILSFLDVTLLETNTADMATMDRAIESELFHEDTTVCHYEIEADHEYQTAYHYIGTTECFIAHLNK